MTPKQKKNLKKIIAAFILYIGVIFVDSFLGERIPYFGIIRFLLYLIPYLIVGLEVLKKCFLGIKNRQFMDEGFLMTIATFGAFAVGEPREAVAVMLFYQVGELFESYAVNKSRKSISDMMDIVPEFANVEVDGKIETKDPDDVEIGEIIVVKPGEKVPLDGIVVSGESMLDTSALTGEAVPRRVQENMEVYSGCVNGSGVLRIRVTKEYDDSTVARILELVENASEKKAKMENFITKFARYYTPIVVAGAVILAVVPPIILRGGFFTWLERACTFLVISCPCALVISVPLSFFGGIGAVSKYGVLVKGGNYLEALAEIKTIVFDKTGTLTRGNFKVTKIVPQSVSEEELLRFAAHAESVSTHPIAKSIISAYKGEIEQKNISNVEEISGHGIQAVVNGCEILAGNEKMLKEQGIEVPKADEYGTIVYLAKDKQYLGYIVISDEIKPDAALAISDLKQSGITRTVMLTGDKKEVAGKVADALKLDEYYAELLPADKVAKVEELLKQKNEKDTLAFVGDGINDAPVLMRADVGIAMGSMGSDAAIEAADVVLMDDNPKKIAKAIEISRKTVKIAKENVVFALGIKILILILGAIGLANMWAAVFADVGVSVLAILNAMRMLKVK